MSVVNPNIRFTYEDYKSLPESMEKRYELLDGDLLMVPAPTTYHQFVSRNLEFILHSFARTHGLGNVLYAPVDVVLGTGKDREVVQPDVLFISRGRTAIIAPAEIQGAPDLIVEVLSPGTEERDRGYKRHLYGRYGVLEYWIVDPEAETIDVIRAAGAEFELAMTCGVNQTLSSSIFPGLEIDLHEVFRVR
ncbi:MAG: Uma2 family endonuclease [Gammaproteobacteria bacterium]